MLHYFPTPYPDELWYSVLCRYHVRSGNTNFLTTWSIGQRTFSCFPDGSIKEVLDMLPDGLFSVREIVLNHTLFPYHSRMESLKEKEKMIGRLESGIKTQIGRKSATTAAPALRYCLVCRKEERQTYGESYWHREHQIPYMTVCPKHHCRLLEYRAKTRRIVSLNPTLPDFIEGGQEPDYYTEPYEIPLSEMLHAYLTAPIKAGPTEGYNNLMYVLEPEYRRGRYAPEPDTEKLYQDLMGYYGEKLTRSCFGKRMHMQIPMRLKNWEIPSPEQYVLLAAFIKQPPEVTFGESLKAKCGRERVKEERETAHATRRMVYKKAV